ncbi:uncharacterized protein [Salvelinus sp. IW2-2015]|uniref:uncharacterized protein isoform X2 n=1 Tax=Salvelinus sp. IW2-2015 TaxID=2691554 RepID=UPI0038D3CE4C
MLTMSEEECCDLETVISSLEGNLEVLNVGKKTLDVPALLLTTLEEMNPNELKRFQFCLTNGRMLGFPPIPESQLENSDSQDTVDQMVKRHGPEGAVKKTMRILMWLKLDDLAEKLERDYIGALLLTSLEELTEEQLKTFQSHLTSDQLPGFPPIPESQLENTDRQETVDQMVKRYGPERAVRNTLMILRLMNRVDLAVKLERDHTRGIPTASFQCFPPPRSYGSIQPFLSRFSSFLPSGSSKQLLSSISGSSGQLSSQVRGRLEKCRITSTLIC